MSHCLLTFQGPPVGGSLKVWFLTLKRVEHFQA